MSQASRVRRKTLSRALQRKRVDELGVGKDDGGGSRKRDKDEGPRGVPVKQKEARRVSSDPASDYGKDEEREKQTEVEDDDDANLAQDTDSDGSDSPGLDIIEEDRKNDNPKDSDYVDSEHVNTSESDGDD